NHAAAIANTTTCGVAGRCDHQGQAIAAMPRLISRWHRWSIAVRRSTTTPVRAPAPPRTTGLRTAASPTTQCAATARKTAVNSHCRTGLVTTPSTLQHVELFVAVYYEVESRGWRRRREGCTVSVAVEQRKQADVDPALRPRTPVAVGLAAGCAVLMLALPLLTTATLGDWSYRTIQLEYPGAQVALTTTAVQVGAEVGAVGSIGALIHLLFLRVEPARELAWLPARFELRVLQVTSLLWLCCATLLVLLRGLDSNGLGFEDLADPQAAIYLFEAADASAPWLFNAGAALLVAAGAWYARRWTGLLVPLFAALVGVLAPLVTGHVLVGPDHDIGGDAATIQAVAAYATFGAV